MCFPSGGGGSSAAAASARRMREEERERKQNIRKGTHEIDRAFKQYNDPYFDKFRSDYLATQTPQIEHQYGKASDSLTAALAERGVLSSSITGNAFGDLERERGIQSGEAANRAFDMENKFRDQVENTKSSLYTLNQAAADPKMIAARAIGETTALVPPTAYGTLGDLFGHVLAPFVNFSRADMYSPRGGRISSYFSPTSGPGSSTVY